jgi:hypothetical protein
MEAGARDLDAWRRDLRVSLLAHEAELGNAAAVAGELPNLVPGGPVADRVVDGCLANLEPRVCARRPLVTTEKVFPKQPALSGLKGNTGLPAENVSARHTGSKCRSARTGLRWARSTEAAREEE